MRTRKNIFGWVSFLVILSLTVGFFSFQSYAKKEPEVYKIGAILPLTGSAAFYAEWGKKGIDLAVDEINASGGINGKKIEIVYGDSKNDPKEGVSWMNKFAMEKLPIVVSAMTGVSFSVLPVAEKNRTVLFMTIVTHPEAADKSEWAFRHYVNKGKAAQRMAQFVREKLKLERLGILFINDEGGLGEKNALKSKFEEMGGKIVAEESFEKTASDVRGQLLKLSNAKPEAIYVSGYGKIYGLALKQAKELKLDEQILASYEPLYKTTQELAGDALEGVIFTSPYFEKENPTAAKFMDDYKSKYDAEPELDAAFGYDVVYLISDALKKGGYNSQKIKKHLLGIKDFQSAVGKINILPNGDSQIPIKIKKIEKGRIISVD